MRQRSSRKNTIAGAFVLGSLALGVWVSFVLRGRSASGATARFIVRFPLAQGAAGLQKGSPVLLGGVPIGGVWSVALSMKDTSGTEVPTPASVEVAVEARADLPLYDNAIVLLERPLLGSLSSINIVNAGSPTPVASPPGALSPPPPRRIVTGSVILGGTAPPAFLAQAGIGGAQIEQIRATLTSVEASVKRLQQILDKGGPDAEAALADARGIIADLRTSVKGWDERVSNTLAMAEKAAGRLEPMIAQGESGVRDVRELLADARAVIAENRARIDSTILSVQRAAASVEADSVTLLNAALTDGRTAMQSLDSALVNVGEIVREQRPGLERTLANFRLMSDQLKLTSIEVRGQPWRLLHEPTTKELSSQVLYDATRAYAQAASDLRAASEMLGQEFAPEIGTDGKAARPGGTLRDDRLAPLVQMLRDSIGTFQHTEKSLLDALVRRE